MNIIQHLFAKYGKRVLLPGALAVIVLFLILTNQEEDSSFELISEVQPPIELQTATAISETPIETIPQVIYVDVKGAVQFPGVYPFTAEDRITDAIQVAGGYTERANTQLINHAQKLQDEMVLYIPQIGEEMPEIAPIMVASSGNSSTSSSASTKVNINQADTTGLTTLPGIGPSKATAIIAHREDKGPFSTIEALKEVTGIGDKTFEQLKDLIDIK